MHHKKEKHTIGIHIRRVLLILAVSALLLCACGQSAGAESTGAARVFTEVVNTIDKVKNGTESTADAGKKNSGETYKVPEFRDAVFHAENAEGNDEVLVDLSSCSIGYVAIHLQPTDVKIKFQVIKDEETITYTAVSGIDQIFPLQSGDGYYQFRVMKNIGDNKYVELYSCGMDVVIPDEFDPFLRPNQYADYNTGSECVKLAASLAAESADQEEFINKVYSYVVKNIKYDTPKAESVQSGYLPVPDSTLKEGKGICFDYASLAASMLRSQGVPTQIIFGYVAPNDLYHAWNKFYSEKDGWKLVEFKVTGKEWNRIDLTFYANKAGSKFIGDGSNYAEAYKF